MKTVIPVAGIGTKLRPHTHTQPKALVPVAGKPILAHIVDSLIEAGQRDFVFIVGYLGDKIESFITERYPNLRTSFVVQEPREGTGHALWLARDHISPDDQMLVILGDTIVDFDIEAVIRSGCHGIGVKKVDDPRSFGVAEINDEGWVTRLHEKPKIPKSNMALVGVYYFNKASDILGTLDDIITSEDKIRDEYNLTDALSQMVQRGAKRLWKQNQLAGDQRRIVETGGQHPAGLCLQQHHHHPSSKYRTRLRHLQLHHRSECFHR